DPAYNALGDSASPEARAAFAEAQGLNDPLPVRYVAFLTDLVRGDLGVTVPPSQPVADRIATAFPLTLQLTLLGLALAVVLARAQPPLPRSASAPPSRPGRSVAASAASVSPYALCGGLVAEAPPCRRWGPQAGGSFAAPPCPVLGRTSIPALLGRLPLADTLL